MPRPPRFTYVRALHHVTLRCNNREFLFEEPWFAHFVNLLQEARGKFPVRLFHYCVMTNHVHLLFQVGADDTLPAVMHWLSTKFVNRFNRGKKRCGHLWQGRYRSAIVEQVSYFFRCMAYVDLNPVRAGIVSSPGEYRWCGHDALRIENRAVLDMHPLYLELGASPQARYAAYREMLAEEAARPVTSLARVFFVGRRRFVEGMLSRFGLAERVRSLKRVELDGGILCVTPSPGTRNWSK
jgi:putative transposase